MRSFVYIVAAVAAVGIAVAVANYPSTGGSVADATDTGPASAQMVSLPDSGSLTLAVPTMHCQYSCFPKVKKALEETPGVEVVELGPQADPTVLDNRSVVINFKSGFDPDSAIAKLTAAGFADSTVVQ